MNKQLLEQKVHPRAIEGKLILPNREYITINTNAVASTGRYSSPTKIIKSLKKAAKEELFPPVVSS